MKKKTLLFICAIVTFILGICAVFVWLNLKSKNHTTTTKPLPNITEKCVEAKNFPGLSKEIKGIEKGKSGYFPKNNFARDNREHADALMNDWYGKHIRAAEEKSLLENSNKNSEIYRFSWLRTFHKPVFIRVEKQADEFKLIFKELDGAGGYEPGKIIKEKEIPLNNKDWCKFVEPLNSADYWGMKTDLDNGGLDGSSWILEGVKDNHYHVVYRWTPKKGKYQDIGLFLLKLSNFNFDNDENSLY